LKKRKKIIDFEFAFGKMEKMEMLEVFGVWLRGGIGSQRLG
jgi:hypothetical protein